MRKLLIGIGIILVLLVGAVLVVPSLVGTDQMTAFLTERLRTSTGYNISIKGPVALSVLPSPRLSVGDIHVTPNKPGGAEIARAGSIEVDVALLPLIDGQVEVTAVTIRDPVVSLDGPFGDVKPVPQAPPAPSGTAAAPAPEAAPASPPPSSPAAGSSKFSVAVRHVQVTNGSFAYRDGGKTYQVDKLDLDLTTEANGAISGRADTGLGQDALHLEGRVGSLDCAQPIPLSLHGAAAVGGAALDFDGMAHCGAGQPVRTEGKVKLAAASLKAAVQPFTTRALPPDLDRPLALDAMLAAEGTKADLTDLTFDLDQTHGVGTLAARLGDRPSVDVTVDFNRLDLDRWLAVPASAPAAPAMDRQVAAVTDVPPAAPWPDGLHVGLDLSAELLSWRGGFIRQARFNGGIDQGTLTINQTTAELPGGTDIAVSGQLAGGLGDPHFTGTIDAETDDLRSVLGWAGIRLDGLPADRFRQASLSTALDLAADRGAATGIDLDLDGSRFKGAANLVFGARPAIGLRLAGDQLNLDAYLVPPTPVAAAPAAVATPAPMPASVPLLAAAALIPRVAANLDLTLDRITWRGQLLKGVHLAGTIEDGAVTVRDARIGDLAGGSLSFSGRWSGGFGATATLNGQLSAGGASAAPLLTLAGFGGQDLAARVGAYQVALKLDGRPDALAVDATLAAQDGHFSAKGRVGLVDGVPHFTGDIGADHPEAARVLAFVAPLYRPAGTTLGPLALSVSLDASAGRAVIDHLSLAIGGQEIDGMATVDRTVQPPRVDADLTASDLVLDPFLPVHEVAEAGQMVRYAAVGDLPPPPGHWSRAKIDVSALGLLDATVKLTAASVTLGRWQMDKPSLGATLKGGTLGLDTLAGGLCGGTVEMHGSLGQPQAVPALALTFSGQDLDLKDLAQRLGQASLTGGSGSLKLDITAAGGSEADLVAALGGTASLAARNGSVAGLDLNAINDRLKALKGPQDLVGVLQAVQGGGSTAFTSLDETATIAKGVVHSTDLHLAAQGGDLTGTVTADLPAWTIDGQAKLALAARPDLPPLAMDFSGPLDRPEKRIDVKSLAAYVAQQGGGGLSGLVNGLTGQQSTTPASPSQEQQKPAQQLQNLFKGLLSKP